MLCHCDYVSMSMVAFSSKTQRASSVVGLGVEGINKGSLCPLNKILLFYQLQDSYSSLGFWCPSGLK